MFTIGVVLAVTGGVCFFIRFLLGPTLSDRAIGVDGFVLALVALLVSNSLFDLRAPFLVVALVVAVMGFIATSAVARFIELRGNSRDIGS